jgi:hypothetical protein
MRRSARDPDAFAGRSRLLSNAAPAKAIQTRTALSLSDDFLRSLTPLGAIGLPPRMKKCLKYRFMPLLRAPQNMLPFALYSL